MNNASRTGWLTMVTRPRNNPLFRPPAEANSLILQVDVGCRHNACAFCGMYKRVSHRARPLPEILDLVRRETRRHPHATRVFLADADALSLPANALEAILAELGRCLPALARVNAYANGGSILAKTPAELDRLKAGRLHTLYMGLESGDEATLLAMHKADTVETMIRAGCLAQEHGLKMSVMVLLGLAGPDRSAVHARATGEALNRLQPRLLSVLRAIPVPGTEFHTSIATGRARELTEWEAVRELRDLVARLNLAGAVFRANHASNIVPLEARLPRDQPALLATLDDLLASDALDRSSAGPPPLWL